MTGVQVNHIVQFCKANQLPRPDVFGSRGKYGVRWFRNYDCAYSDYSAAMLFLVSQLKEKER